MLQIIQLIMLFSVTHIGCLNMHDSNQTKEVFVQKVDEKVTNYVEITSAGNDSLNGIFYGVEIMPSKELLYYKAKLTNFKIDGKRIQFTLDNFLFSTKSFYDHRNDSLLNEKKPENIPFLFNFPIKYFGYRNVDTLKMNKVTLLDDSNFEESFFIKKI